MLQGAARYRCADGTVPRLSKQYIDFVHVTWALHVFIARRASARRNTGKPNRLPAPLHDYFLPGAV